MLEPNYIYMVPSLSVKEYRIYCGNGPICSKGSRWPIHSDISAVYFDDLSRNVFHLRRYISAMGKNPHWGLVGD